MVAYGFITMLCASLYKKCEFVVFSNVCVNILVHKCLSGHTGRGSPGARQYGAVVQHTPLVKTQPMGLGQLWPTYTATWAITSLMTYPQIHISITTILETLSSCLSLNT